MFRIFYKLYLLLNAAERRKAALLCFLFMIGSVIEVAGVASILPFIAVLSYPGLIESNDYLSFVYKSLEFSSHKSFMIFLGLCFLVILVMGLAIKAVSLWAQLRFSLMRSFTWSLILFEIYLQKPYEWYLNHHSSRMVNSVVGEVRQVVQGALLPALQAIAGFFTSVLLLILLIIADPVLAVIAGGILGGLYIAISFALAKHVQAYGIEQREAQRQRQRVLQETFGGIKAIKISGLETIRVNKFSLPAYTWASNQIKAALASQIPNFAMQALLFGGMLLLLLYLIAFYGGLQEALPVVALFAFATYRLLPNVQRVYSNASLMLKTEAVLDSVAEDLHVKNDDTQSKPKQRYTGEALGLRDALELDRLTYSYPGALSKALVNISIKIPAKSTIGLVGTSGAGKTTLVDIMLGLLPPASGNLIVDGQEIKQGQLSAWQKSIGYVPQQLFLLDDTVTANIAFGVPKEKIDQQKVETAAKAANLHKFVESSLPQGYETTVGERGVRMSGGQRQRLGIARALYHDPDVLIFDEATSALDNLTEQMVMEAIDKLGSTKTIIIIAHRLSTVQKCDCIYLLDKGRISAHGSYEELLANSAQFQELAVEKSSQQ